MIEFKKFIDAFEEVNSIRKQKGVYRLDQDK
jgi:hypothetical protein